MVEEIKGRLFHCHTTNFKLCFLVSLIVNVFLVIAIGVLIHTLDTVQKAWLDEYEPPSPAFYTVDEPVYRTDLPNHLRRIDRLEF